ncbi:unnamed protein product [Linum tenue]|uniref:DYW domain-containing protein n=1 Tax=Linum tenue TaxID=586396 RepID=A0AAV0PVF7_9ROSI|nr:unnamed protein product [Linum tenue]
MPERNVVSWTTMVNGYMKSGRVEEAEGLFRDMPGKDVAAWNAMIHGYCGNGRLQDGLRLFECMPRRNVVSWTSLIGGLDQNGKHEDALMVFIKMIREGVFPNQSTFTSVLNSCRGLEAVDKGREVHTVAIKLDLETDVSVGNSLLVMYTECGNVHDSVAVFKRIEGKNTVSWNSIIVGSAQHGCGIWALIFFNQMLRTGFEPDEFTFTGLLSACSRSGMLQKGRRFFEYITRYKSASVDLQHYTCMVDILGRSGKLHEAEELVKNMPMKPNSMVWLALLSACRVHSNVDAAERAAKSIFSLDPHCSAAYVLLSNLYASAGRWADVSRTRVRMRHGGVVKERGSSWVVMKGKKHEFVSGDRGHPLIERIYEKLRWLREKLKEVGYVADQRFALHDVEDEQKEEMLWCHSERLAIGFALISSVEGSGITVMKNLRVCGDCHEVIKLISGVVGREIVVRDSGRFHHFKNGVCSCSDYW